MHINLADLVEKFNPPPLKANSNIPNAPVIPSGCQVVHSIYYDEDPTTDPRNCAAHCDNCPHNV